MRDFMREKGLLEKLFYLVSICGAAGTVIWSVAGWAGQTQKNADDVKVVQIQYAEIIIRLTHIEDRQKARDKEDGYAYTKTTQQGD
jgi:hypothetical protein